MVLTASHFAVLLGDHFKSGAGETWNVSSLVGLIGLFCIAVQNGLVLISQTRSLIAEGRPFEQSVREASIGRLRPKIMTAATAILGLLSLLVLRWDSAPLALRGSLRTPNADAASRAGLIQ